VPATEAQLMMMIMQCTVYGSLPLHPLGQTSPLWAPVLQINRYPHLGHRVEEGAVVRNNHQRGSLQLA